MPVTALYASLLAPLFILLSVRVIGARASRRVAIGDGGDAELVRRMRVQANFAEYAPLALILLGLAESLGTHRAVLHGLGLMLVIGRAAHAWGVSRNPEPFVFRQAGMGLTFTMIALATLACLAGALPRLA